MLHIALMAVSLALLPILPSPRWKPSEAGDPSLRILLLLAVTIGLPYILLSTTSPLLQAWYVAAKPGAVPYRLFALSNFGSLLALLSYPVLIEPLFTTHGQAYGWSGIYVLFAAVCGAIAWSALRTSHEPPATLLATVPRAEASPPSWVLRLLWTALSACASALLLAITNHLSQNVAPIPFLWVLPLAVYLLSFILCFEREKVYHRGVFLPLLVIALGRRRVCDLRERRQSQHRLGHPNFYRGPLHRCMVCNGELARLKPDPRYLTSFYLMIALGGALGGAVCRHRRAACFSHIHGTSALHGCL
jgi:hypothetical protein